MGEWVRALTIDAHGGLEQLRFRDDLAEPSLSADNDVRVRLRAAALNHIDLWTLRGVAGVRLVPPWIMGSDGMGVVAMPIVVVLDRIAGRVARMRPEDRDQAGQNGAQQRQKDDCLNHQSIPLRMILPENRLPLFRIMRA